MAETVSTRLIPVVDVRRMRRDAESLVMPSLADLRWLCDSYEQLTREVADFSQDVADLASIVERVQRRAGGV